MTNKTSKKSKSKLSLFPLSYQEAVTNILAATPPPKSDKLKAKPKK
jgi:hypothetical protein